jgi:hypothetical protein
MNINNNIHLKSVYDGQINKPIQNMKNLLLGIILLSTLNAAALDPNHFIINRVTAPYFIVDGNSPTTINKAYVGFKVRNVTGSAVTYNNLKFTITSISTTVSGQTYSVVAPSTGIANIGTLAPGESKICYFYVQYPAHTTAQGTFNLVLSDNTGTNKTAAITIRNRSSISANAGGAATQTFTNQDVIGGVVYDDVTYVVGNSQNGDEADFQVAVSTAFDPTKITLLGTEVTASSVPNITVGQKDTLYFLTGNGSNGASVTIRWTFRITAYNFTTNLLPCAGSTSGSTNYKYALNTALGSGSPITVSSAANPLTITKTSDKATYGINAPAIFTVVISNPSAYPITVDKIVDQLPTGFTFTSIDAASQVTSANSTTVPAASATGTITFEGGVTSAGNTSYYIAAGSTITLKYRATSLGASASNLLTTAKDYIGITEVGSTTNTVAVSSTLPVTLISFSGNWQNNNVKLDWKTASEFNSNRFEIEKINGSVANTIGTVSANGNSSVNNEYSFIDAAASSQSINLYRLKMIDNDGHFKYSSIVSLSKGQLAGFVGTAFPNPFVNQFNIIINSAFRQQAVARVLTIDGHTVYEKTIEIPQGSSTIMLEDLNKLPAGTYFVQLQTATGLHSEKIVKR